MSVCGTREPLEIQNSKLGTMFSAEFSQVIPKNALRLRELTLKCDLRCHREPKLVLLQEKEIFLVENIWRAHLYFQKLFWINHEAKNAQKVVNGGDLHGLTSVKRSDGFIISLW